MFRSLKGQVPLWQAFWFVGVLGFILLLGYALLLAKFVADSSPYAAIGLTLVAGLLYTAVVIVSIWRCSKNTKRAALGALAKVGVLFFVLLLIGRVIRAWNG